MRAILVICLPLLCACEGAGELDVVEASGKAISFSSNIADQGQGQTRASALARDFTVYGYKYTGTEEAEIFPGWTVKCQKNNDDTYSYDYLGVTGQTQRYWDTSATAYRFWATAGNGWSRSGKTLQVNNHPLLIGKTGNVATDLADNANLYASVIERKQPISESTVALQFNHPYSQVSVYFYYETLQPGVAKMQIRDVTFAPVETQGKASKIFNQGTVKVQYPANASADAQETVTVTGNDSYTRPSLEFIVPTPLTTDQGNSVSTAIQAVIPNFSAGLELPDMPGTDLTRAGQDSEFYKFYYPLPMGEQNPDFKLTMYITLLDADGMELQTEERSAIIPAAYMQWKPNYAYRYFFKISGSGLSVQYDVQIDPWTYGGKQEEEWKNW